MSVREIPLKDSNSKNNLLGLNIPVKHVTIIEEHGMRMVYM